MKRVCAKRVPVVNTSFTLLPLVRILWIILGLNPASYLVSCELQSILTPRSDQVPYTKTLIWYDQSGCCPEPM
ncbi:unnamed protein product [Caretta caretta]